MHVIKFVLATTFIQSASISWVLIFHSTDCWLHHTEKFCWIHWMGLSCASLQSLIYGRYSTCLYILMVADYNWHHFSTMVHCIIASLQWHLAVLQTTPRFIQKKHSLQPAICHYDRVSTQLMTGSTVEFLLQANLMTLTCNLMVCFQNRQSLICINYS